MKSIFSNVLAAGIGVIVLLVYRQWFISPNIIGGDWWYLSPEMLGEFTLVPPLWTSQEGLLGGVNPNYPFFSYSYFIIGFFVNILQVSWGAVEKLFYFFLFIVLCFFSMSYLTKTFFPKSSLIQCCMAALIFVTNTYILLVAGGGQAGITLAYAIAPFVLALFIKSFHNPSLKHAIIVGIITAIQVIYDIRITYLTIILGLTYLLFLNITSKVHLKRIIASLGVSFFIVVGIHAYWLLPFFLFNLFSVPQGITSLSSFVFFSFATFENALGLLHPNWPENIFGKVQFMRPEFLVIPVISFFILISRQIRSDHSSKHAVSSRSFFSGAVIFYFLSVALIGTFLAKGTNEPFGLVNKWMFDVLPGMNLFRDPTKFYLFIAISYAILIPQSLEKISGYFSLPRLRSLLKLEKYYLIIGSSCFVAYWAVLIWPAITGDLSGTFQARSVPDEYLQLAGFLHADQDFFRTLWVPFQSRFRYYSEDHPLINAQDLFRTSDQQEIISDLAKNQELLQRILVKYIIVPSDSEQEIFVTNREYDHSKRIQAEQGLDQIPWLTKVKDDNIVIYELPMKNDRFTLDAEGTVSWQKVKRNYYLLNIAASNKELLTFSESYNPNWVLMKGREEILPQRTTDNTMQFLLPAGTFEAVVFFKPESYLGYGYSVTALTFFGCCYFLARKH